MNNHNPEIQEGQAPTEEDKFYIQWGRETIKNNLNFANEVLRQLITLNSALLGGSIVFLDEKLVKPPFRGLVISAFTLSLIFSFIGMMPYEATIDIRSPQDIKDHKQKALKHKRIYLWIAGFLILAGFLIAFAGVMA
jgi:hypothetical protein